MVSSGRVPCLRAGLSEVVLFVCFVAPNKRACSSSFHRGQEAGVKRWMLLEVVPAQGEVRVER